MPIPCSIPTLRLHPGYPAWTHMFPFVHHFLSLTFQIQPVEGPYVLGPGYLEPRLIHAL